MTPEVAGDVTDTEALPRDVDAAQAEGALLALGAGGIVGWARDLARPDETVEVVLLGNGVELGRACASRFDDDLVRGRVGPGIPGFAIRLAQLPAGPFPLRLELRDAAGRPLGSPLLVASADELRPALDPAAAIRLEGNVDGLMAGRLVGWAWDAVDPGTALRLELFDGAERLAVTIAEQSREDLRAAGKRGGRCGFSFDLPATLLDGRAHSLRVRIEGSTLEVPGGPLAFGPAGAPALFDEVVALRTELKKLADQVEKLTAPTGPFQREVVRTLAERVAALAEVQRDLVERELDVLRAIALNPAALDPGLLNSGAPGPDQPVPDRA